ncbi:MAG: glycosyltransferase family 4 protein [Verrucomicrobiota bacterium]
MRILILTNVYPPHHAATYDYRCYVVAHALRKRGHDVQVLTSNHGVKSEQRDDEAIRRLHLNGVFGHPVVTTINELKPLEFQNHAALQEAMAEFQPELIHVWSLHGLSKSLVFGAQKHRLPVVFDVADTWIADEIRTDPWLTWWNTSKLPFTANAMRSAWELSGQRDRMDESAPTRDRREHKRLAHIYDPDAEVQPDVITTFRLDRIYFSSQALKELCTNAGFRVSQGNVIYQGVDANNYRGHVKPPTEPTRKFLVSARLTPDSGVMRALEALARVRETHRQASLNIYGRGDSDYVAKLKSYAVRFELPVEFMNVSDPIKDMPAVFRQHEVFLHTSEGRLPMPTTPLEAMAAGMPVISSIAGGSDEVLRQDETALLFTPGSAEQLANHMKSFIEDTSARHRIALAGQTDVIENYNYEVMVTRIESFLEETRSLWSEGLT